MTTRTLPALFAALVTLALVAPAQAAITYDDDVTPGIIFGSGNLNGSFTIDRANGVEVGLRGKLRHNASGSPENTFNSNGDGSYTFQAGVAPTQAHPTGVWSFEWSINSNYDNSTSRVLDDLTYALAIDNDPTAATSFATFDPINGANPNTTTVYWDHSQGTNSTTSASDQIATSEAEYATFIGANNVAQNSWKAHWFVSGFDPNVAGTYTFSLTAYDGATALASTSIDVNVVPEPSSFALAGLGLVGLGWFGCRRRLSKVALLLAACLTVLVAVGNAHAATFDSFVIRDGSSGSPTIQANNTYVPGATEFIISEGGMKAGWGSNDLNGHTIGDIAQVGVTRYDDTTRFTSGSGPAVAPYFNIWVTDGGGNYAVIANEPSNPAFHALFTTNVDGSKTYDLSYSDLAYKTAKVYETPGWNTNSSWVHTLFGNDPLTFADVASLTIEAPSASYIGNSSNGVGSGAPDELGTNVAYGFNWVLGDTLSNYVSGAEGYVLGSPTAAVPEPSSLALAAMGFVGLTWFLRKKLHGGA